MRRTKVGAPAPLQSEWRVSSEEIAAMVARIDELERENARLTERNKGGHLNNQQQAKRILHLESVVTALKAERKVASDLDPVYERARKAETERDRLQKIVDSQDVLIRYHVERIAQLKEGRP